MNTGKMSPSTPRRRAQGSLPAAHVAEMQLFPHLRILGLPLTPRVLPLLMCPQDISAHLKNDFLGCSFQKVKSPWSKTAHQLPNHARCHHWTSMAGLCSGRSLPHRTLQG